MYASKIHKKWKGRPWFLLQEVEILLGQVLEYTPYSIGRNNHYQIMKRFCNEVLHYLSEVANNQNLDSS